MIDRVLCAHFFYEVFKLKSAVFKRTLSKNMTHFFINTVKCFEPVSEMINSKMYCGFDPGQTCTSNKVEVNWNSRFFALILQTSTLEFSCLNWRLKWLNAKIILKKLHFHCMTVFDLFSKSEFVDKFFRMINRQTYQFAVFFFLLLLFFFKEKCIRESQFKSSKMITRCRQLLLILIVFFLNLCLCRCSKWLNRWLH